VTLGVLATAVVGALASAQVRPAGTVDPHFRPVVGVGTEVSAVLPLPDGRIVIGGDFTSVSGIGRRYLAILLPDGSVDLSFDPGNVLERSVKVLALAPDGRLVVGNDHDHTSCGGFDITRFNGDGSVDATIKDYDPGERAAGVPDMHIQCPVYTPGLRVLGLASQQDGRILVATDGYLRHIDPATWRWDQAGDSNVMVLSLAQHADGRIAAVAGRFWIEPGVWQGQAAWLGPDGSVEQVLPPSAAGWEDYTAVTVQPDGKLVLGALRTEAGTQVVGVVRLHPDGTVDDSFAQTERFAGTISSLALDQDGGVVVVAVAPGTSNPVRWLVARLLPNGAWDGAFVKTVVDGLGWGRDVPAVSTGEGVLVGGRFAAWSGERHEGLVRLDTSGNAEPGFAPQAMRCCGTSLLAAAPGGGVWVTSEAKYVNGVLVTGLARLGRDGALEVVRGPENGPNRPPSRGLLLADGRLLVTGPFTAYEGVSRVGIARLLPDGALDTSLVPDPRLAVISAEIFPRPDGSVVLVSLSGILVSGRPTPIVRVLPNGTIGPGYESSGWMEWANLPVSAMQPDGKVVLGSPPMYHPPWTGPVRVDLDGSLDMSFQPSLRYSKVRRLLVQSDGRIVAAGQISESTTSLEELVRFLPDGSIDRSFPNPAYPRPSAKHATLLADDRIVITSGYEGGYVRRLMPDGAPDPSFVPVYTPDVGISSVVLDGALVIQGGFSSLGGVVQPHLAKVLLERSAMPRRRLLPFLLGGPHTALDVRE